MGYPIRKWNDVLSIISGKNQKVVADSSGQYPIYGSGGIMGYANNYLCEAGTTIIGRKGTINRPIFVNERFWNVDTAFGVFPGEMLHPKFLFYFCQSFNFKALDKSTTIPSLAKRDLLNIEMPVPSFPEQEHIISRIEELFSQLDASVAELKTAKERLKVYRQAVLKEAFEELKDSVPMHRVATMIDPQPSHRTPPEVVGGIPYVGIGDIDYKQDRIMFEQARKVSPSLLDEHKDRYEITEGDFIMGKIGTIGKPYRLKLPQDYALSANVILIQSNTEIISPEFLFWQFSSPLVTSQLSDGAAATSQAAFGIKKARNLKINICPLPVQREIVRVVNEEMSVCDSIEKTVDTALQQAEALRQSILKNAFEGNI